LNRPPSDFQSKQGDTSGLFAPAECGQWWYRFFQQNPSYTKLTDVDPTRMQKFRDSVAALTAAFDRPILFKNLYASMRIQAIAKYLPESLFIIIQRNEIDNGHSILEARFKNFSDYSHWFSIEPPSIQELKVLPAHQQVIEQIRHIHKTIDKDLRNSGVAKNRCFNLIYENFCDNPGRIINKLQAFFEANECKVNRIGIIPKNFLPRKEVRIEKRIYKQMVEYSNSTNL